MLPQIIHILHLCPIDSLVNYAIDVVNWIEVTAVRWPRIWRNDCTMVAFVQLLRMASLQTLQTNIAAYDNHYTDNWERDPSLSISGVWRPSWLSVISTAATFSSVCACALRHATPCLRSVLRVSYSILSNASSPAFVQFYPEIQPVVCMNILH